MTEERKDPLTAVGAANLANTIALYWAERGHAVRVVALRENQAFLDANPFFVVRSDLKDGLPRSLRA